MKRARKDYGAHPAQFQRHKRGAESAEAAPDFSSATKRAPDPPAQGTTPVPAARQMPDTTRRYCAPSPRDTAPAHGHP